MKVTKKVLSLLLSLCMVMSCFAISAFAAEEQAEITYVVDKVLFTKAAEVVLTADKNFYNLGQEDGGAPNIGSYKHLEFKFDFKLSELPQTNKNMGSIKTTNTENTDTSYNPIQINSDGSLSLKPDEAGIIEAGKTYTAQYRFHIGDTADTYDILLTEGGTTKLDMKNISINAKKFASFQYLNLSIGVGTVLSNMSVTSIVPETPTVEISVPSASNSNMSTIAAGKNIKVNVASYYCDEYLTNGGVIKIFNNGAEVSSSAQENFSQICTINVGSNNIYAAVYDSEGTLIDKSSTYTVQGLRIAQHETGNWSTNSTTSGVSWNFNKKDAPSDTNMYTFVNAHSELTVDGVVRNNIGTATWDNTKNLNGEPKAENSLGITQVQYAYPGTPPTQLQTAQGRFFEAGVEIKYSEQKPANGSSIFSCNMFTTYDGTKYDGATWNIATIATTPEGYLTCGLDLTDVAVDLSQWHKYSILGDSETDMLYFYLDDEFVYAKKCSVNFTGLARANSSFDNAPGKQVTAYVDNGYLSTFDLAIPTVTASAQVASDKYFAGKKININVNSKFCDDILASGGVIKIFNNGAEVSSSDQANFSQICTINVGSNNIYAAVYDSEGTLIDKSSTYTVQGLRIAQHETGNWSTNSTTSGVSWNFNKKDAPSDTNMYTFVNAHSELTVDGVVRNNIGTATWDNTKNLNGEPKAENSLGITQVQYAYPGAAPSQLQTAQGRFFEAGVEIKYSESKPVNSTLIISANLFTTYDGTKYDDPTWNNAAIATSPEGYLKCGGDLTDVMVDLSLWHKYSVFGDSETDMLYFFLDDEFIYAKKCSVNFIGLARANSSFDTAPGKQVTAYVDNGYLSTFDLAIPMVTASAQVASDKYFAGKKVNINVQSKFCDDILADGGSIKLYKNGSLLETSTSESFAASVIVEDGINALEAVVYNKDGEVVANDNSLKIKAVSMLQHPTGNWSYDTESGLGTANWNFGSSDTAMYTKQIAAEYTDKVTGEIRNRVGIATWDDTKNLDDTEIAEGSVGIHQVQSSHPNSIVNNMNAVGGQGSIFEAGIELKYSESKLNKNEMTVVSCNVFTTYDAETGYAGAAWRDVNMSVGTDGYIYCSRVKTDVRADITNWHKYSIMCDTETDTMYFFVDDEFIYSKKSGNDIKGYARANTTYDYFPGKKVTAYFDNPYVNTYNLSNAVNAVENLTVTSGSTAIDSLASATAGAPLTVSGFIAKNAESADEAVNVYVALYKGTALSAVKLANVALSDDYNQFSITIDEAPADIASGFTMKLLAWNTSLVPYFTSIDPFAN